METRRQFYLIIFENARGSGVPTPSGTAGVAQGSSSWDGPFPTEYSVTVVMLYPLEIGWQPMVDISSKHGTCKEPGTRRLSHRQTDFGSSVEQKTSSEAPHNSLS